mmetsp:Transcript_20615/g.22897  ORF Transcript_20615/g.22897 Transcript_20615/m.22897 type:complete len:343 (-) Transcript_20615:87-1115(-)
MGCAHSNTKDVETKRIDDELKAERKKVKIKMLLLGAGDSGKSTFAKQMKVLKKGGFTATETQKFAEVLRDNALSSIKHVIFVARDKGIKVGRGDKSVIKQILEASTLTKELAEHIQDLHQNDKGVQRVLKNRHDTQLPSSVEYYFKNVMRIYEEDFKPTNDDIFRAKLKTTGIVETNFESKGVFFKMVDVGGQRNERRKWLHCFEDVTSVIYLAALDEYDMQLFEDRHTNRMAESLNLFGEVSGSKYFADTSWILFLNKHDIFRSKFPGSHERLKALFPGYTGEGNADQGLEFIKQKYKTMFEGGALYIFVTCAVDTDNIKEVFHVVEDTILMKNLGQMYFS